MTLEEAIEVLESKKEYGLPQYTQRAKDACQLGIEALEAWGKCRREGLVPLGWVLPDEAEGEVIE